MGETIEKFPNYGLELEKYYLISVARFLLRNRKIETPATPIPPVIDVIAIMVMVRGNSLGCFPFSLTKVSGSTAICVSKDLS